MRESCSELQTGHPAEKVPMDPEDFAALLAWVKAKERQERVQ